MSRHPDPAYGAELEALNEDVLLMGAHVEEMLWASLRAFCERDTFLAEKTARLDDEVDALESRLDQRCLRVLARFTPVASDLRYVTSVLKIVTRLERMGDLAEGICRRTLRLGTLSDIPTPLPLQRMGEQSIEMVHAAIDAFAQRNIETAVGVLERDQAVGSLYAQVYPELLQSMQRGAIESAACVLDVARNFERVADQATNIAEFGVYLAAGSESRARHAVREPIRSALPH